MDLKEFFRQHPKAAIAFSGGVDSSYLLYAALQCGADGPRLLRQGRVPAAV